MSIIICKGIICPVQPEGTKFLVCSSSTSQTYLAASKSVASVVLGRNRESFGGRVRRRAAVGEPVFFPSCPEFSSDDGR